jgi:hypothetical protein
VEGIGIVTETLDLLYIFVLKFHHVQIVEMHCFFPGNEQIFAIFCHILIDSKLL